MRIPQVSGHATLLVTGLTLACLVGLLSGCQPATRQSAASKTAAASSTAAKGTAATSTVPKTAEESAADPDSAATEPDGATLTDAVSTDGDAQIAATTNVGAAETPSDETDVEEAAPANSPTGNDTLTAAIEATVDEEEPAEPTEPFVPEPDIRSEEVLLVPTDGLKRLHPEYNVWVDAEGKRLVMAGEVCKQEGLLEMFACLKGTKEHEAVVNVFTKAFIVHAGLLALGAEPGNPVEFRPEYKAAAGPEVEVTVFWKDEEGETHEARGQDWVRAIKTKEPLASPWVFGGSGFWTNGNTGEQNYMAEDGDFICVSNFPSAMLDLPIESSQAADSLVYEVFAERVPPVGTTLTLVLTPKLRAKDGNQPNAAATPPPNDAAAPTGPEASPEPAAPADAP